MSGGASKSHPSHDRELFCELCKRSGLELLGSTFVVAISIEQRLVALVLGRSHISCEIEDRG
jgi:hypothetical protein